MRRLVSWLKALILRWYVIAALMVVAGVAVGYYAFFNVGPGRFFNVGPDRPQIGIIDIPFTVIGEDSAFFIGEMVDLARRDDSIKGVVIKLTTPGGGAAESERLYFKVARLREKKPVIISTGSFNASGGMMMSVGANEIYVETASLVGSIGVIFGLQEPAPPDELLISSGPAKLTGGTQRTFTGMVELLKDGFVELVVKERGDRLRISRDEVAEARLYTGIEAVKLGLVDTIGSDTDAVKRVAKLAGISNYELVDVNELLVRRFVLQTRRVFASPGIDESDFALQDVKELRNLARSASGEQGQPGVPEGFPIDVNLPRFYFLYVTPTE